MWRERGNFAMDQEKQGPLEATCRSNGLQPNKEKYES